METHGGPRGAACREGFLYVSVKVGYYAHIARHDLKTGERQVVIDQVPSGGWHEPGPETYRRGGGTQRPVDCQFQHAGLRPHGRALAHQAEVTGMDPVLVELDEQSWRTQVDRFAAWLGNVQTTQAAFREHLEETVGKIHEPHIRMALEQMAELAREHERQVGELYKVIGREPSGVRQMAGEVMAELNEAVAKVQGSLGGAVGAWRDIHRLLIANLNALGAFAVAETLGLALAYPEIVAVTILYRAPT